MLTRLAVVLAMYFFCMSDTHGQLNVKLVDADNIEIPYANTQLISISKTDLFLGAASDTSGIVTYSNLLPDEYFMIVKYLGFKTDTIKNIKVVTKNQFIDLGTLTLVPSDYLLKEVNIIAKGPTIVYETNGDYIYNPGKTAIGSNEDADRLLETIPGVGFNSQEGYMINGNTNIIVVVDGRQLSGDKETMNTYLQSIASENIESVKIMKSGGTKYDASASGGVINIITKKSSYAGINGFIYNRFRQGQKSSYKGRFSLNWKHKKFSGNMFYEYSFYQGFHEVDVLRNVQNASADTDLYEETVYESWKQAYHLPRFFINYDINKNHRVGLLMEFRYLTTKQPIINNAVPSKEGVLPDSIILSNILKDDIDVWPAVNFNYAFDIKGKGNNIDITYDFFYKDINKKSLYNDQVFDSFQDQLISSTRFRRENIFMQPVHTASVDFSKELKRDIDIDIGGKVTILNKVNESLFERSIAGQFVSQPNLTRSFDYLEKTYAGYVNWSKHFNGWNLTLGLRIEHTDVDQLYISEDRLVKTKYLDYFPSIVFYKEFGKKVDFKLSYNRGFSRPRFLELDPIRLELGPFLVSSGNPNLRPQLDNIVGFEFTFSNKYSLFATYNSSNYSINSIFEEEANNVYNYTYVNFNRSHFFTAGGNVGTDINDWWTLRAYLNFYFDKYNISLGEEKITSKGASVAFSLNSQFILPKEFYIDLVAKFESPRYYAIERYLSTGYINAAISKNFLDKKLVVKLGVYDILRTRKIETTQKYSNLDASYFEVGDSRRFELLINFRFRKGENFRSKKNIRSNDDERIRS